MAPSFQNPASRRQPVINAPSLEPKEIRAVKAFLTWQSNHRLMEWAKHPKTRPDLLKALGYLPDSAIQQAVTSNPSTDLEELLRLGKIHPEEFLDNPAFLFEECLGERLPASQTRYITNLAVYRKDIREGGEIQSLDQSERIELTRKYNETIWVRYLAKDPDPSVRTELAARLGPPTEREIRDRLLADPEGSVRVALAKNRNLGEETYIRLADDPDPAVRKVLAANSARNCGAAHWKFLKRKDGPILLELARNPAVKGALACELSGTGFSVRCALAERRSLEPETVEALLSHDEKPVKLRLASNPGLIEHAVSRMFMVGDTDIMEAIVSNDKCPHLYLSSLAHQGDERVQLALVGRGELPALLQLHLARTGSARVRQALVKRVTDRKHRHPSPVMCEVCETLARDPRADVRIGILSDPRLGSLFLNEKAAGCSVAERRRLACNPSTPLGHIMDMACATDPVVAMNATGTLLRHAGKAADVLGDSRDPGAAATYLRISRFLGDNIASFSDRQRELLVKGRNTPHPVLGAFAETGDPSLWKRLLARAFRYGHHILTEGGTGRPEVIPLRSPPTLCAMVRHVRSRNPYIRGWAALNFPLPVFLREILRRDPSPYVQYVMKFNYENEDTDTNRTCFLSA